MQTSARVWKMNDLLHRENGQPAIEHANGNKEYYENGQRHRAGGLPAVECGNGYKEYFERNLRHREGDKPAIEHPDGYKAYFVRGLRHRVGGPAIDDGKAFQAWYVNGVEVNKPQEKPPAPTPPPAPVPAPPVPAPQRAPAPAPMGVPISEPPAAPVSFTVRLGKTSFVRKTTPPRYTHRQNKNKNKWKKAFFRLQHRCFIDALTKGPGTWRSMDRDDIVTLCVPKRILMRCFF